MRRAVKISLNLMKVLSGLIVMMTVSCERRPLFDPNELVKLLVKVNISTVANVTCDIYNENIPIPTISTDMMRVLIYDPETGSLLSQSFLSSKEINEEGEAVLSGTLNISHGDYDFIVYNFDTPTTQVTSESEEKAVIAYTDKISEAVKTKYLGSKAQNFVGLTINEEPDHLVVARERNYRISPHDTLVIIETEARTIIDTYYLQIHVEGMQYASQATAIISGLSPSNKFALDLRTNDPTTGVYFDLVKSTDKNIRGENKDVLCAVFNTFGKIEDVESDLLVTFNVIDTAGNLVQYETSLNTIFQTEEAIKHHWLLIEDTFVIPDPGNGNTTTNGSGFQPEVGEWEQEEGEINL